MHRSDIGEIYAIGWFVVLLSISKWADTQFMPIGIAYLISFLPLAIFLS